MHIAPFDNQNLPIIGGNDPLVPLVYFNIVRLKRGESLVSRVPGCETCIVPATGTVDEASDGQHFANIGLRRAKVWDGEPEEVYVPTGAGARFDTHLPAFAVRAAKIDPVQYGSDDTKTHRNI